MSRKSFALFRVRTPSNVTWHEIGSFIWFFLWSTILLGGQNCSFKTNSNFYPKIAKTSSKQEQEKCHFNKCSIASPTSFLSRIWQIVPNPNIEKYAIFALSEETSRLVGLIVKYFFQFPTSPPKGKWTFKRSAFKRCWWHVVGQSAISFSLIIEWCGSWDPSSKS